MADLEQLGEQISSLRKDKNLTQKELAELLHVSSSAVSKWERGTATPDIYMIERLAEVFGISVAEFMGEKSEEIPEQTEVSAEASQKQKNRRRTHKWIALAGVMVLMLSSFGVYLIYNANRKLRIEVVDEFLDETPDFWDYESIYYVVLEYDGVLTQETALFYPEETLRAEYAQWFDEVEVLVFSYWKKGTYEGREHVLEAECKTVLLPEVLME